MLKSWNLEQLVWFIISGVDGQKGEAGSQGATGLAGPPGGRGIPGNFFNCSQTIIQL